MAGSRERVRVAGRELTLTNLDKIIYPETGTTKADVLAYYAAVAHVLIPAAANRPATRKRWVNGVGTADRPGEVFFQKDLEDSAPGWLPRAAITHKDRTIHYPLVNDAATLTWFGQINSLEIHVPAVAGGFARQPAEPGPAGAGPGPGRGRGAAGMPRGGPAGAVHPEGRGPGTRAGDQRQQGHPPLRRAWTVPRRPNRSPLSPANWPRALEADHPDLAVSDMKKSLRRGKVLVDWSQNNAAKTTVVPYSLRGRPTPMVAAPRTWREIESPKLKHLDYHEVLRRVRDGKDPFAVVVNAACRRIAGEPGGADGTTAAIHAWARTAPCGTPRRRRNLSRASPRGGNAFVIQEHHASRLHWDLRLEHEGVLASWALPKGVPESGGKNHLAVQTEDHPMDYLTFHGTIPKGQYGAGEMTIWDTGTYELHKWINGKEVIVTLTGSEGGGLGGPRKFALIHTGRGQGKDGEKQWLIHLMDPEHPGGRRRHAASQEGPGSQAAPETRPAQGSQLARGPGTGKAAGPFPDNVSPGLLDCQPMMATAGTEADLRGSTWQYELKWDGVRAILVADQEKIRILSRNGNDVTRTYPELTDRACWPEQPFVADGEIIAVGPGGRPDFGLLQGRMKLTRAADVAKARTAIPVQLMLFDLLFDDGKDLRRLPLSQRRRRLEEFFRPSDCPVDLSMVLDEPVGLLLESAKELGLEGVMAKRTDSRYVSGQRTRTWIKLKLEQTQEVVVGGWRPGKGGREETVGSLLVGIPDGDKLRYVGRVGSGFSTRELTELRQTVERLGRKTSPFHDVPRPDAADAHWVAPELVGEVTYSEWTGPGRLRHPRWRGWRVDKDPAEVVRE